MSILSQELLRKISDKSQHNSETTSSSDVPDQRFRQLMKTTPVDDKPKEKDFFSLLEEEEQDPNPTAEAVAGLNAQALLSPLSLQTEITLSEVSALQSARSISIAHFEALFERMASNMIIMCSSGETVTTLLVDNPQSMFFGAEITIREFSTAPKVFNVEITAGTQAVAALEAGKQSLLSAFQNGKFNFSVHRIDTHFQHEERPVLHRKESEDQGSSDQQGGQEQ
jgi:hypothetical protein